MQRSALVLCGLFCFALIVSVAGDASAALTVTIIQPATNPSEANINATVGFQAVAFQDGEELENANVQWEWQFGDAMWSDDNPTSHAYVAAGDYLATVTARLGQATAVATTCVTITDGPEIPKKVPFDPALSVYVGFSGHWINYATGQSEFREIEAPVALFGPGEQVSDDSDIWGARQTNSPQTPAGWNLYGPDDSEPMQMHVIIRDTQNRLGNVLITNRDTGAEIGTIDANAAGSQIEGFVTVASATEAFLLDIRDRAASRGGAAGNTMAQAAADMPGFDDMIVCALGYAWNPNRGHEGECRVAQNRDQIWGDPKDVQGKVAFEGLGFGTACCGETQFTNDDDAPGQAAPKYPLLDKAILRDINAAGGDYPPDARVAIIAAVQAARASYQNGASFLDQCQTLPFSTGTAHWKVDVQGEVVSLVGAPIKKRHKINWSPKITTQIQSNAALGNNQADPSIAVAAGVEWSGDLVKVGVGKPIGLGSLYGLRASGKGTPFPDAQGITTPVTITLRADKRWTDDSAGPTGGTGIVTNEGAWTDPSPPQDAVTTDQLIFPADGDSKGVCTVQLAKGFKYKVTGRGGVPPFYSDGTFGPFNVPATNNVTVNTEFLVQFGVEVHLQGGTPAGPRAGEIELKHYGGEMVIANSVGQTGSYTTSQLDPGPYQVRGRANGGDWCEWYSFQAEKSTLVKQVTLTVVVPPPAQ